MSTPDLDKPKQRTFNELYLSDLARLQDPEAWEGINQGYVVDVALDAFKTYNIALAEEVRVSAAQNLSNEGAILRATLDRLATAPADPRGNIYAGVFSQMYALNLIAQNQLAQNISRGTHDPDGYPYQRD